MDTDRYISRAVKVQLARLGIDQQRLSELSNVAQSTLSLNINGRSPWKLATLNKIAKPLGFEDTFALIQSAQEEKARDKKKSPQVLAAGNEDRKG